MLRGGLFGGLSYGQDHPVLNSHSDRLKTDRQSDFTTRPNVSDRLRVTCLFIKEGKNAAGEMSHRGGRRGGLPLDKRAAAQNLAVASFWPPKRRHSFLGFYGHVERGGVMLAEGGG